MCAQFTVSEQSFLQKNISEAITQIHSNNKRPDLKSIHSYLVRIKKVKELSEQYLQELILQPEDGVKLVNKKFKGADSFFITETKTITDPPQSPDPSFPIIQDTPLTTPSPDKISNLQLELHKLRTEVVAMKSVFSEQLLLIKENQKLVNEQPINDSENNSELIKSLLDQIEYLRRENFVKKNIISNLLKNNKVLFNNEENFSCTSNNSNLNNINNQKLSNIDNSNF